MGKQLLFLYERREIFLFLFLMGTLAFFSFTLGVHLGKRVKTSFDEKEKTSDSLVPSVNETFPSKQDLSDQNAGLQKAMEESLDAVLKEELKETPLKIDVPRAVDLPRQPKAPQSKKTVPPVSSRTSP